MGIEDTDSTLLLRMAREIAGEAEVMRELEGHEFPELPGIVLLEKLGQGGMGVVFKAQQLEPDRTVAVKFPKLPPGDRTVADRFKLEVAVLARMEHESIARVYEARVFRGWPYLMMEYVQGAALDKYVLDAGSGLREILSLVQQAAVAVAFIHSKGVLHHDLKPSNIMVQDGRVKVVDFGLAGRFQREAGKDPFMAPTVQAHAGTLHFLAPELIAGEVDAISPQADVYALGVILYQLLTGSFPHEAGASAMETMRRITEEAPRYPVGHRLRLPSDLCLVLLKAVDRNVRTRYAGASELAMDLGNVLSQRPVSARAPAWGYLAGKHLRRNWRYWLVGALAMGGVVSQLVVETRFAAREERANEALGVMNNQLEAEVSRADADRGVASMQKGESDVALAYFARALRRFPGNRLAARAAANTVLHGRLPVFLGEERLEGKLVAMSRGMKLRTTVKRDPLFPRASLFATTAGIERWDMVQGQHLGTVMAGHAPGVAFDVRQDGLVTGVQGTDLEVFQITDSGLEQRCKLKLGLPAEWVCMAGAGDYVAVPQGDGACLILKWNGEELIPHQRLQGPGCFGSSSTVAFVRGEPLLAAVAQDRRSLARWHLETGEALPPGEICAGLNADMPNLIAGASSGEVICMGTYDVLRFEARSGRLKAQSPVPGALWPGNREPTLIGPIMHVAPGTDGGMLAVGCQDLRLRVFSAETGEMQALAGNVGRHILGVIPGRADRDGADRLLALDFGAATSHGLTLWNWRMAERLAPRLEFTGGASAAGFAGDGCFFVALGMNRVQRWRLSGTRPVLQQRSAGWACGISLDAAWEHLVFSGQEGGALTGKTNGQAFLTDVAHHPLNTLEEGEGDAGYARMSPDGKFVVSWKEAAVLQITPSNGPAWEAAVPEQVGIQCCAISADSRWLAMGLEDGGLRVWDVTGKNQVCSAQPYKRAIKRLTFSPVYAAGSWLAAGVANGQVKLWRQDGWKALTEEGEMPGGDLKRILFHPSESAFLVQMFIKPSVVLRARVGEQVLWDAAPFADQCGAAKALAISADGQKVAVGNEQGSIFLFDWTRPGTQRSRWHSPFAIHDLSLNPDGTALASGGLGGKVQLWDTASGESLMPGLGSPDNQEADHHMVKLGPQGDLVATTDFSGSCVIRPVFTSNEAAPLWLADWLDAAAHQHFAPGAGAPQRLEPLSLQELENRIPSSDQGGYARLARQFVFTNRETLK
jgi:Protein kinase domain/WD domain, G-beta repeat